MTGKSHFAFNTLNAYLHAKNGTAMCSMHAKDIILAQIVQEKWSILNSDLLRGVPYCPITI